MIDFTYDGPVPLVPLSEVARAIGLDVAKTRHIILEAKYGHIVDIGIWMFRGQEYVELDELIEILLYRGHTYGDAVMSQFVK